MAKGAYIGVQTTAYFNSVGEVAVGRTVKINENGSPVDYIVIHQGNPDSTFYDSSCDGTWLLRKDIYTTMYWDASKMNKYAESDLHNYLNGTFLSLYDSDIQSAIKQVKIPYTPGYGNYVVSSGSNGLSTKLFALSIREVNFTGLTILTSDGVCLEYFKDTYTGTNDSKRIAYLNGTPTNWWLRTPATNNSMVVSAIYDQGGSFGSTYCTYTYGVRPALILPSSLILSNGVVTSSVAQLTTKSVARKIKGGYIGIEGVARRIKKSYIGIGGVARPCWNEEATYYGTIAELDAARYQLSATRVGSYAIFGSGFQQTNYAIPNVTIYNSSLARSTSTMTATAYRSATSVGNYALFAGGWEGYSVSNVVDAFNSSLSKSSATLHVARMWMATSNVGNYAIFGGGSHPRYGDRYTYVDTYDTSLTHGSQMHLSVGRCQSAATNVGDYALFAGGNIYNDVTSTVETYNASLTRGSATELSYARYDLTATTVGNYALFVGGYSYNGGRGYDTVDAYNESLTHTIATVVRNGGGGHVATTVGNYALFYGGAIGDGITVIDAYDKSLTHTILNCSSAERAQLAATTVGNYALFGGGFDGTSAISTVDVFTAP